MPQPLYFRPNFSVLCAPTLVCELLEGRDCVSFIHSFVHSVTYSFSKHLLSTCHVASTLLGTQNPAVINQGLVRVAVLLRGT